jgi:hypothetical protein
LREACDFNAIGIANERVGFKNFFAQLGRSITGSAEAVELYFESGRVPDLGTMWEWFLFLNASATAGSVENVEFGAFCDVIRSRLTNVRRGIESFGRKRDFSSLRLPVAGRLLGMTVREFGEMANGEVAGFWESDCGNATGISASWLSFVSEASANPSADPASALTFRENRTGLWTSLR